MDINEIAAIVGELERMVLTVIGPIVGALTVYEATVVQQHADGAMDLRYSSAVVRRIAPDPTRVPYLRGAPGVTVKVKQGCRVLVCFIEGSLSKPRVLAFLDADRADETTVSTDATTTLDAAEVRIGAGASRDVAGVGDVVEIILPPLVATSPGGPVVSANPLQMSPTGGVIAMGIILSGSPIGKVV